MLNSIKDALVFSITMYPAKRASDGIDRIGGSSIMKNFSGQDTERRIVYDLQCS
jgi:hypothetical protein